MWVTQTLGEVFHLVLPSLLKLWKLNISMGRSIYIRSLWPIPQPGTSFCTLRFCLYRDYTSTTLHTPLHLLHSYLCGSMSFTRDKWGFRHTRVFICAWQPKLKCTQTALNPNSDCTEPKPRLHWEARSKVSVIYPGKQRSCCLCDPGVWILQWSMRCPPCGCHECGRKWNCTFQFSSS